MNLLETTIENITYTNIELSDNKVSYLLLMLKITLNCIKNMTLPNLWVFCRKILQNQKHF